MSRPGSRREDGAGVLRSRVPAQAAGRQLLDYLVERFRYLDAAAWRQELAAARLTLDGKPAQPNALLRRGAELCWHKPQREPYADVGVAVLHTDAALLVVDKPAHLPMHADGPFVHNTLVQLLRQRLGVADLQLVHRLDRETSGVCVVARTAAARASLQAQFAAGTVRKVYRALVRGTVTAPFTVAEPIGRAPNSAITLRRAAGPAATDSRPATTRFWPEAHGPGVTLLRCEPATGRTHQIRVHLEANGTPVFGDKLYGHPDAHYLAFVAAVKEHGDARRVADGVPDRHLLHASELTFAHPESGLPTTFRSELPPAFPHWLQRGAG